ncbi:MAG: (d)CMP kinase [Clostridia bacterium]
MNYNVAIDGPSGAGKSTIAKMLAKKLNIVYLDTGAMYRCLGLKALREQLVLADIASVQTMLDNTKVDIKISQDNNRIFLDGEEVTNLIRTEIVGKSASDISALPIVRIAMANIQRQIAIKQSCILDGREIGSYVLPNAQIKIFLTASKEIRAKRRYMQLQEQGVDTTFKKVLDSLTQRDYNDSSRSFAPLIKVADAIEVDTTELTLQQTVDKIYLIIKEKIFG